MAQHIVPFYPNTPDNTHCYQAALKMVLKFFWPEEAYSLDELDEVTAKVDGLWTWPIAGLLWLQEKHAEVSMIDAFDFHAFVKDGGQYLLDFYGDEVGSAQIAHSDIEQEISFAQQALKTLSIEKRSARMADVKALLEDGFLVICNVNANAPNNKEGYTGHFVVITGFDENGLYMHDPGLPPRRNRRVSYEHFTSAWAYPDETAKWLIAVRKV
ncbi:MAG: peptidase C39 family protein [Pseudomonadales bacterium]|nr:peptidase C39 family protein [Pseudomonadales bacterium]